MKLSFCLYFLTVILSGCGGGSSKAPVASDERRKHFGSLLGEDFLSFGGNGKKSSAVPTTHVNPFLWRATLEVLSTLPLASSDAMGGVIVSDWSTNPTHPKERLKVVVHIRDRVLRSDAIQIQLFKENQNTSGVWVSATPDPGAARALETAVLTRARALNIQNQGF